MIDIITHTIIDMNPSRDYDDVKKWLCSFPNLKVVSRDGSITYSIAITAVENRKLTLREKCEKKSFGMSFCVKSTNVGKNHFYYAINKGGQVQYPT